MVEINSKNLVNEIFSVIDNIKDQQSDQIKAAAKICGDSIAKGGVIQVFGSGHSVGFGLEMKDRVGSLVSVHNIVSKDFVKKGMYTYEDYSDMDNIFERRPNIAQKFYELYDIREEDVFIIISNSGINGLVIDLAMEAKRLNHQVIVITSLDHTLSEDSRHPSQKKLKDFADVVIDNCGPKGDALLPLKDGGKIGSVSSIANGFIAGALTVEIVKYLDSLNIDIPLLSEDSKENEVLKEKYKGRV